MAENTNCRVRVLQLLGLSQSTIYEDDIVFFAFSNPSNAIFALGLSTIYMQLYKRAIKK